MQRGRVLITGANGFTGCHLVPALVEAGYEVIGMVVDAAHELPQGTHGSRVCDLLDAGQVARTVVEVAPSFVVHLAGIAFVAHEDPGTIYATNLVGTRNLLEALCLLPQPPRRTLLASSANIYGDSTVMPMTESTPAAPMNDYAVSKLAMEYMARLYASRLPMVVARPFNYTGRGQSANFLIPKIVDHVLRHAPSIELGNLDVARDFSDVRFLVHCYRRLLEEPAAAGMTVNVCSGRTHTLREVLDAAQDIGGHRLEVRVNPALVREHEVKVLAGSRELLDRLVPDAPDIPLRDTLRWMLASTTAL